MGMSASEQAEYARRRKERILTYLTQDPPVSLVNIMAMEGVAERPLRLTIKELEDEHGLEYLGSVGARTGASMPYGLTEATARFRARLADHLYRITDVDTSIVNIKGRTEAAPIVGLNPREQIRAEQKPFAYDWSLSQMERLARALGKDPRDFILDCLSS